ncbi:hypothetical protein BDZ89DRAFT_1042476 [Hymenopellis radicata]|nr:hypothetical protein BDZ89DRAFT_1042476 [Hymenopellis radicata]
MPKILGSSPPEAVESTEIQGRQTDHISKLTNSWMLFWQTFVKSVRLEGESMTVTGERASMLWAVMSPAEKQMWEVKAAENRKTLHGRLRFAPPIVANKKVRVSFLDHVTELMNCKGTRKYRRPAANSTSSSESLSASEPVHDLPQASSLQPQCIMSPLSTCSTLPEYGNPDESEPSPALSFVSSPYSISSPRLEDSLCQSTTSTEIIHDEVPSHLDTSSGETSSCYANYPELPTPLYLHEAIQEHAPGLTLLDELALEPNIHGSDFDRSVWEFFQQDQSSQIALPRLSSGHGISALETFTPPDVAIDNTGTTSDYFDWDSFLADLDSSAPPPNM